MKILKPGKAEQRKFVCPKCGCVFVASRYETEFNPLKALDEALCPTCNFPQSWWDGKHYEEPAEDIKKRLLALLKETPDVKIWPDAQRKITDYLIAHGVTFRK